MKRLLTLLVVGVLSFGLAMDDAEAKKRFGGGSSFGKQRDVVTQKAPAQPGAPAAAGQPGAAQPAMAGGAGRWLGPLAGLAAGGLLGAMLFGGAFEGINFMDVLLFGALAAGAFFLLRALRRPQPASAMQYAGAAPGGPSPAIPAFGGGGAQQPAPESAALPPGFDTQGFLRQAKVSFVRLQAANDSGDLRDIRDYTTPEVYAEVSERIRSRGDARQHTEVVTLEAELLEVATEGDLAIASVRFSGLIREDDGPTEPFAEIWHVQKDLADPRSTWLIAGIQQTA